MVQVCDRICVSSLILWGAEKTKWLSRGTAKAVWFAPPCGTAAAAREIRRKHNRGQECQLDPKPLRSQAFPDGMPGLLGTDAERVRLANLLYKFTSETVTRLTECGVAWAIENPTSSRMWDTSYFKRLTDKLSVEGAMLSKVTFQADSPVLQAGWEAMDMDMLFQLSNGAQREPL